MYTYTPSPADCRLARPFRTSSLLLTVPDAHTHTRLAQCLSSLDVVSTILESNSELNADRIGRETQFCCSVRDVSKCVGEGLLLYSGE